MKKKLLFAIFIAISVNLTFGQNTNKQANTLASDIIADTPYKIDKTDENGNINAIPIHVFIHDSDCSNCTNSLIDIRIYIKDASNSEFPTDPINFGDFTEQDFNALFSSKSPLDTVLDIKPFEESGYTRDFSTTINFTSDTNTFLGTPIPLVKIKSRYWYFTIDIPASKLIGFEDIIDIKVEFNLDYSEDYFTYMRVFREELEIPKISNWYRGDTHYHAMFTQNTAEIGLPLEATKRAAKIVGLDWITTTDHSCDFDNYGISMSNNWNKLGDIIENLNSQDSSFLFIRGVESSVNNSDGKIIHALTYPNPNAPFSLPYVLDGKGDLSGTDVSLNMLLDSLEKYDGFCVAAHPYAELDKLSSAIDGGVWNVGDSLFLHNGESHPSIGSVICNNLEVASDIYNDASDTLFKKRLKGAQIWNLRNTLTTDDDANNPWNAIFDQDIDAFHVMDLDNPIQHLYRLKQNFDVSKFTFAKSLKEKNNNPNIENWKLPFTAGSDAHGSFNFSTTDFVYGVTGDIHDNAIGKLNTMAYCPNGMGENAKNVLQALKDGHTIMTDGPILTMEFESNNRTAIINDDIEINENESANSIIKFQSATTSQYGNIVQIKLIAGTETGEYEIDLPIFTDNYEVNLDEALVDIFGENYTPKNEYFYIRAELKTLKFYTNESAYRYKEQEFFNAYTNPIWIKRNITVKSDELTTLSYFNAFPNPFKEHLEINYVLSEKAKVSINVLNIIGENVLSVIDSQEQFSNKKYTYTINANELPSGVYIVKMKVGDRIFQHKLISVN